VTAPTCADDVQPTELKLTLLHTNDVHGHLLPFFYQETGRGEKTESVRGGVAARMTIIRQLRASITNPVMLIDSGDIATRGPLTTKYEGLPDIDAMNAAGYELAEIGNNEFKLKDGVDQNDAAGAQADLLRVLKRSKFPWICANLTDANGALIDSVRPYFVRDIDHVRVGFLGLTTGRSASYPQTKGWIITDPIEAAKKWIPIARKDCDVLIALTHDGVDSDKQLAAQTTGIDAIVGGDSHTFLYTPVEVKNLDGITVPIVQDGEFGVDLGRFDLDFTQDAAGAWHLGKYTDELIPVLDETADDPAIVKVLLPYTDPLLHNAVGVYPLDIGDTAQERTHNSTQFVMEALRSESKAIAGLNPPGYGMFDAFRDARVTDYDIHAVLPFHNNLVTVALTGAKIKAMAAGSVVAGSLTNIVDDQTYEIALVDYVATSCYKIPASDLTDTGRDIRDVVHDYLAHRTKR